MKCREFLASLEAEISPLVDCHYHHHHYSMDALVSLIFLCREQRDRKLVFRLHSYLCRRGLEVYSSFGNQIISMMIDLGFFERCRIIMFELGLDNLRLCTMFDLGMHDFRLCSIFVIGTITGCWLTSEYASVWSWIMDHCICWLMSVSAYAWRCLLWWIDHSLLTHVRSCMMSDVELIPMDWFISDYAWCLFDFGLIIGH